MHAHLFLFIFTVQNLHTEYVVQQIHLVQFVLSFHVAHVYFLLNYIDDSFKTGYRTNTFYEILMCMCRTKSSMINANIMVTVI